jgi:hypothetical protein
MNKRFSTTLALGASLVLLSHGNASAQGGAAAIQGEVGK